MPVGGEKFRYSGFWSKDIYTSIMRGSEVELSYYQAFDGTKRLASMRIGNIKVLSKFQSLSGAAVFPGVGGLLSLFFIFLGFRDLRQLRRT